MQLYAMVFRLLKPSLTVGNVPNTLGNDTEMWGPTVISTLGDPLPPYFNIFKTSIDEWEMACNLKGQL